MAAACQSLQHIFENPLPENPTLLETLSSSWNQIKPSIKPIEQSSFTEIFGELHFKENNSSHHHQSISSPASSFPISPFIDHLNNPQTNPFKLSKNDENNYNNNYRSSPKTDIFASTPKFINNCHKKSESFSLNSESLQLCTEGLGFESSDDVEDMKNEMKEDWQMMSKLEDKARSIRNNYKHTTENNLCGGDLRKSRTSNGGGGFPPPISCIGKSGKPWVCFKSYRQDGRFVLKEVRIPTQEFLHACREDGRLKLHFVQPNDEILEEDEEFDEEEEDEEEIITDEFDHHEDQLEQKASLITN
ncbi:hypothetical protein CCACVL1_02793 [Corchorus capsularis]|uniref:FAF domain-containing protein n=1 Tax=Corchorus capsularis TaxID=210143 RepID=A0A1R3K5X8_COCAP|nr:hypothetical protein CCACVL1_02793 [Corchorus capsularis]